MKIAEAIGQTRPFRNNKQKAAINLFYTHNWMLQRVRAFFKTYGITEKQYNILRILNGADKPLTTSTIRNRLIDKMSDTTRVIDRMIKKGVVQKKVNSTDRRLVDITLTREGKDLLGRVDSQVSSLDKILSNITLEEADQLSGLLDKLRNGV